MASDRRLLILSCSQRKRSDLGLLPAIERYDGGHFRLLRKARREGRWPENLDMLILSAKHGLIDPSTPIASYEQRMTHSRAKELKTQIVQALQTYAGQNAYCEVYVDLGQIYQSAIEGLVQWFNGSRVIYAEGRVGERLARLKEWLRPKSEG